MSIYFIAQRKRDIAIRKTFGSSSRNEMLQLMKFSFSSLLISLIIAIPLMAFGIHTIDKMYHTIVTSPGGCHQQHLPSSPSSHWDQYTLSAGKLYERIR